jgi:hypothetical protein
MRVDYSLIKGSGSSLFNGYATVRSLFTAALEVNFWMWFQKIQVLYPEIYQYIEPFRSSLHMGM